MLHPCCLYEEPRNPTPVLRFANHGPRPSSDPAHPLGGRVAFLVALRSSVTEIRLPKHEGVDHHFRPARIARRGGLRRIRGLELNRRGNANGWVGGYGTGDLLQRSYWRRPYGVDVL